VVLDSSQDKEVDREGIDNILAAQLEAEKARSAELQRKLDDIYAKQEEDADTF